MRPEARRAKLFVGQKILPLTLERNHAEYWKSESPPTVPWGRHLGLDWPAVVGASWEWRGSFSWIDSSPIDCGGNVHSTRGTRTITNLSMDLIKPGKTAKQTPQSMALGSLRLPIKPVSAGFVIGIWYANEKAFEDERNEVLLQYTRKSKAQNSGYPHHAP